MVPQQEIISKVFGFGLVFFLVKDFSQKPTGGED